MKYFYDVHVHKLRSIFPTMRKYFQVSTRKKSRGSQVWDINQIRVQYEDQISDILDMIKPLSAELV